jgi:4-amino-4-deoxy-L-arabinose transferase-like glycosyltransferase
MRFQPALIFRDQGMSHVGGQRIRIWFWAILALALVLRVCAAIAVQRVVSQTPGRLCLIAGDAEGYWELGRRMAKGQDFAIYEPPRRVLRMPGFPAVLALSIRLFGEDVGRARLVLALIGTLACGAVFWLARDIFSPEIGLIAAALAAVCPTFIVFSVMILSETTFALGLLLSLIALQRVVRLPITAGPTLRLGIASLVAGLGAALACYVRPSWLLFPPVVMAWLWVSPTENAANSPDDQLPSRWTKHFTVVCAGLAMLLGLSLGLAPWTVRNYFVTDGKFVPTTLWMGPSLYDGLNPTANGDSHMEFLPNSDYEKMSEYDVDRHYRREAWKWAAANPGKVLALAWIKLARYWNLFPNTPQFDYWYVRAGLLAFIIPVLGCAIWGVFGGMRHVAPREISWTWVLILTLGPIMYFSALHTLFVSSLRYRLPAEYPLLVLSAVGIRDIWHRKFMRLRA